MDRPATPIAPTVTITRRASSFHQRIAGVWARVLLGVLLGVAIVEWPYERGCGFPLAFYLTAVSALLVTGLWGAFFAWNGRVGTAHVIALGAVMWALVLTAQEVLPRIGYARLAAAWQCDH